MILPSEIKLTVEKFLAISYGKTIHFYMFTFIVEKYRYIYKGLLKIPIINDEES